MTPVLGPLLKRQYAVTLAEVVTLPVLAPAYVLWLVTERAPAIPPGRPVPRREVER